MLAAAAESAGLCPADRIDPNRIFPITQTQYRPSSMPLSCLQYAGHRGTEWVTDFALYAPNLGDMEPF